MGAQAILAQVIYACTIRAQSRTTTQTCAIRSQMPPAAHCVGYVPSDKMGLLKGTGGWKIQEPQRLSDCHLSNFPSKEHAGWTQLNISSSSSTRMKAGQQEKVAAGCLRAARLVCLEGKT